MSTCELNTVQANESKAVAREWRRPQYNISENADAFEVKLSVPGVNREGVDISVEDEVLILEATRQAVAPEGWNTLRRELPNGDFRLALRINVPIDEAKIEAKVADGILSLRLPKAEAAKPLKIQVS